MSYYRFNTMPDLFSAVKGCKTGWKYTPLASGKIAAALEPLDNTDVSQWVTLTADELAEARARFPKL